MKTFLGGIPAFTVEDFEISEGYDETDFDTITWEDTDEEQVTYKGYSLHTLVIEKEWRA